MPIRYYKYQTCPSHHGYDITIIDYLDIGSERERMAWFLQYLLPSLGAFRLVYGRQPIPESIIEGILEEQRKDIARFVIINDSDIINAKYGYACLLDIIDEFRLTNWLASISNRIEKISASVIRELIVGDIDLFLKLSGHTPSELLHSYSQQMSKSVRKRLIHIRGHVPKHEAELL